MPEGEDELSFIKLATATRNAIEWLLRKECEVGTQHDNDKDRWTEQDHERKDARCELARVEVAA